MKSAVKKRRGGSTCSANAIAPGRISSLPDCGPWSAISTTTARWCWSRRRWRSPLRPRPPTPRWCAPSRRWASPGCASLSRPWSAGSAPRSPRRKRCAPRSPRSPATSIPVLILCWKAINGFARSCRGPTTARRWLRRWHCSATHAGGDLRYRRLGDPRRIHRPAVQPHWPAGVCDEPHGFQPRRAAHRPAARRCADHDGAKIAPS